ncbi:MAG: ATP phosphoribosyltransferase regulatory subunit [Acetivibrionales bacterium]|jgi:ATP phosphoribosyltransferase regulatory subunit|nr:ATP phosphoribosyltransferase regulatory subunit [Clostridiaceae bacterium]
MRRWNIYTPEGVQDILFESCSQKRVLESKIRKAFKLNGYKEIEPPTIEFYDTFGGERGLISQESMYKFCDSKGRLLVLRPDLTVPVARIAATKLKDEVLPLKCCYIGNTFSFDELGGGRQHEFTQAGCELLGINSPEADAEVVAMAIETIRATGIDEFQIDIGQVGFFKGLMEESGLSEDEIEEVREFIDQKNLVGVEQVMDRHQVKNPLKRIILDLPKLFGSKDILQEIKYEDIGKVATKAIENIKEVLDILEDRNLSQYVSLDLGMVQSLNYYTGIVFRGYTYGVGFPILSGGRYDKLVAKFGRDCEATGFSLGINMVMMALERQKKQFEQESAGVFVTYEKNARKLAGDYCRQLIANDCIAELDIMQLGMEESKKYATAKGFSKFVCIKNDGSREEITL